MSLSTTIRDLKSELARVEARHKQLADAVRVLESFAKKQTTQPAQPKKRRRHFVHNATCLRCGDLFKAKRHPAKNNPSRGILFCHKPCTSSMYYREQRQAETRRKAHLIIPGDPLRATMGQH